MEKLLGGKDKQRECTFVNKSKRDMETERKRLTEGK